MQVRVHVVLINSGKKITQKKIFQIDNCNLFDPFYYPHPNAVLTCTCM